MANEVIISKDIFNMDVTLNNLENMIINVKNDTQVVKKVALIPAFYKTGRVAMIGDPAVATLVHDDVSDIVANGFPVAAVAFDGTKATDGDKGIHFSSGNPSVTIEAFLTYLKSNPRKLKKLQVVSDDQNAFSSSLEMTIANPLGHGKTSRLSMGDFFSAYQNQSDRITMDFTNNQLELSDVLMMCLNIPALTTLQFTFKF